MKTIGSIVFATTQGLGILAKAFFDNKVIHRVLIIPHHKRKNHYEWYPDNRKHIIAASDLYRRTIMKRFLADIDATLLFETPFNWEVINICREMNKKVFMMPMYECMPKEIPVEPDVWLCPSDLDMQYYPKNSIRVTIPVDNSLADNLGVRKKAITFVHNAGNWGLLGRNGTEQVIQALPYITTPIHLVMNSQIGFTSIDIARINSNPKITVEINEEMLYEQLYKEDVFLFPERFNGLSLPLQEAYGNGMLVIATDRFPMNTWLPKEPLIPVAKEVENRIAGRLNSFIDSLVDPIEIARKIDTWFNRDIESYSLQGKEWARKNCWRELGPVYDEILNS